MSTDIISKELLKTKRKLLNKKLEYNLLRLHQQNFIFDNKTCKLLAKRLKQQTEKSNITSIEDISGNTTQEHNAINETFRHFYSKLYTPGLKTTSTEVDAFLRTVSLPKLDTTRAENLDKPVTIDKLRKALQLMLINKSPRLDGYPVEFYKHFWSLLSFLFYKMISETLHSSKIPHRIRP